MAHPSLLHQPSRYDWMGLTAGFLCAIHCAATPFVAALVPVLTDAGGWWGMLDVLFLVVSLIAVWGVIRSAPLSWVRWAAPLGWVVLALGLAAERYGIAGSDLVMYLGGAGLLVAHLANIRHCRRCPYCVGNA
ncbi:MerC domain-containing protein [Lewinella sp. IMCC34191]|uniref:MerC domain-containing protein n=1 Tax=Lewinella sp. IMCC34191 TaxID=2259172 RepID=UPI000E245C3B|nr:MerC domain-containing protein [Lewinella sp. IMCC34191]